MDQFVCGNYVDRVFEGFFGDRNENENNQTNKIKFQVNEND